MSSPGVAPLIPVMLPGLQMMAGYHGIVRLLPHCPPWDVLGTEEDVAVSSEENQASPQVHHLLTLAALC